MDATMNAEELMLVSIMAVGMGRSIFSNRRRRRWWVRPINTRRREQGEYHNLFNEMRLQDVDQFFKYTRMNPERFERLLRLVGPELTRRSPRKPISEEQRLAMTLRYLATGDSFQSIAWGYRVGKSTACTVIRDTCDAIWRVLSPTYVKTPDSPNTWKEIAEGFFQDWNFPNCVGAIDGKHVTIKAPNNSGSQFYNYKHNFSVVLLAVCDSKYRFTMVDIGSYGSQSDGGILKNSVFGQMLATNSLGLPGRGTLNGCTYEGPFYFVGDEAFPLKETLMRPFPGKNLTHPQRVFNYRLSRARRCIENAFGILSARWQILRGPINAFPENVDRVVQAAVCLHNFLRNEDEMAPAMTTQYCPGTSYVDRESDLGDIIPGRWREEIGGEGALTHVRRLGANVAAQSAHDVRRTITDFLLLHPINNL